MLLNKFPEDLQKYFDVLSQRLGNEHFPLTEEKPWFFEFGVALFKMFHPDAAVKRLKTNWRDLRVLYGLQIARSKKAAGESDQEPHFHSVCSHDLSNRDFGQLPCTVKSINFRLQEIERKFEKNDPILILGDDDALSVALANKGFSDITVFEIDEKVVGLLTQATQGMPNKPTIFQQDVLRPVPDQFHKNYALISFDPWYAIDGLQAFMTCGLNICKEQRPDILLSFNCGFLLQKFLLFHEFLNSVGYEVESWSPLANTYPAPRNLTRTLKFAEVLVTMLSLRRIFKEKRPEKSFFSSDLLWLKSKT